MAKKANIGLLEEESYQQVEGGDLLSIAEKTFVVPICGVPSTRKTWLQSSAGLLMWLKIEASVR